jgi:hypothetical protein
MSSARRDDDPHRRPGVRSALDHERATGVCGSGAHQLQAEVAAVGTRGVKTEHYGRGTDEYGLPRPAR